VPILVGLAVIGAAALAYVLFGNPGGGGDAQTPQVTTTAPPVTTTPSSPTKTSSSSSSSTSSSSSSTTSTTTSTKPADNAGLAKFIKSYYSDVTKAGKRDATFAELTPAYQAKTGGRQAYENFWSTIKSVDVGETQADASVGTVITNLTFKPKGGGDIKEVHRITVEQRGGSWLISADDKVG
jgi:cytoskeletal protein RodZ